MEEGWVAAADAGRRNRPPDHSHRKNAHSAAIVGIIAGTVLLVGLDAFVPGKPRAGGNTMQLSLVPTLTTKDPGQMGDMHSRKASFGVRVPTESEKLADIKFGHIFPGSMLADEESKDSNSSEIDHKIQLQPSPEGPLAHVIFNPPKGVDYKVKVDVYIESRKSPGASLRALTSTYHQFKHV
jgi:hypothetical protein